MFVSVFCPVALFVQFGSRCLVYGMRRSRWLPGAWVGGWVRIRIVMLSREPLSVIGEACSPVSCGLRFRASGDRGDAVKAKCPGEGFGGWGGVCENPRGFSVCVPLFPGKGSSFSWELFCEWRGLYSRSVPLSQRTVDSYFLMMNSRGGFRSSWSHISPILIMFLLNFSLTL